MGNKKQQKSSQNDVRLQRALADVQKYKDELQDALRQRKELGNVARHEATELEMEKNKTRKNQRRAEKHHSKTVKTSRSIAQKVRPSRGGTRPRVHRGRVYEGVGLGELRKNIFF